MKPGSLFHCYDCRTRSSWYMVLDEVWNEAVPEYRELKKVLRRRYPKDTDEHVANTCIHICLSCLEIRLKRPLCADDFDFSLPINQGAVGIDMRVLFQVSPKHRDKEVKANRPSSLIRGGHMANLDFVDHGERGGGYGQEIIVVSHDGLQVLAAPDAEGHVATDYIRVFDVRNKKEVVYWSIDELEDHEPSDPSSTFNTIISTIQLVASGSYRAKMS